MKKEKGSALLTVILVVAVTATIGAALVAMILINFRLRAFDTHLKRAEYQAEEIIDITYVQLQILLGGEYDPNNEDSPIENLGLFKSIKNEADEIIDDEVTESEVAGTYNHDTYWLTDENGIFIPITNNIKNAKKNKYNELIVELSQTIDEEIKNIIKEEQSAGNTNFENTEVKSADYQYDPTHEKVIILDNPTFDSGEIGVDGDEKIIQKITFYYKVPEHATLAKGGSVIQISADFVIMPPTYEDVGKGNYNISEKVGIQNWRILNDRGYL